MNIAVFIFWYKIAYDMALLISLLLTVRPSVWQRDIKKFTKIVYRWKSYIKFKIANAYK